MRVLPWLGLIAVAVCGVFGGMLDTSFHFDDENAVLAHRQVLSGEWQVGWDALFLGRGLVTNSFVLCKRLSGLDSPAVFHAVDLALHLGVLFSLFFFLRSWFSLAGARIADRWLAAGVLFYGIHPAISQGVVFIAQRYERLCMLFFLLSLLCFTVVFRAVFGENAGQRRAPLPAWKATLAFLGCVLFAGLALGSKENAVTLPVILLLSAVAWLRSRKRPEETVPFRVAAVSVGAFGLFCMLLFLVPPDAVLAWTLVACGVVASFFLAWHSSDPASKRTPWGFAAVLAFCATLQIFALRTVSGQISHSHRVTADPPGKRTFYGNPARETRPIHEKLGDYFLRNEYFLTQARVRLRYLQLLAFPNRLNVDYDIDRVQTPYSFRRDPDVLPLWGVWIGAFAWAVWAVSKRGGPVAWGILWMLVGLAPTSTQFILADLLFEHRLYLPAAGMAWVVAAFLSRLDAAAGPVRAVTAASLVLLGSFSAHRVGVWKDDRTLYADSVRNAPRGFRQRTNLGLGFLDRIDLKRAEREQLMSVQLFPKGLFWVEPFGNLGNVYLRAGDLDKAARCYRTVINMNSDYKGRVMLAKVHAHRRDLLMRRGEPERAGDELQMALAQLLIALRDSRLEGRPDPRLVPEVEGILRFFVGPGQDPAQVAGERLQAIEAAMRDEAEGSRLRAQGSHEEAMARFDLALKVFPLLGRSYAQRGMIWMDQRKDLEKAVSDLEASLGFPPFDPEVYRRLERIYRDRGDLEAASRIRQRMAHDFPHFFYPRQWSP